VQDEAQRTCSGSKFGSIALTPGEAAQVVIQAQTTFKYPASGQLMGDWKKGEALAQNGVGMRLVFGGGDDPAKPNGGNCYACHQIDPKEINHGTLGPSLAGFGTQRGNTPETQKYVYEKVYNSWAYFPCSSMPRFGHNGFLKPEQIVDVVAYLLDPASPVNRP
jgi:sulfur-oxidizing protein SoxX